MADPAPNTGADLFCWLCDAPMVVEEGSNTWKNRELHSGCFNAVRCHNRKFKTAADNEVDKLLMESDEEEWTSVVRGLVAVNELRSEDARRDSGQVEDDLLLTKRRFIS